MKTIVTPDSAVMGLPNERSVYLNGDHLSICKFQSRSSTNYHSVADAIFRLAAKIVDQSGWLFLKEALLMKSRAAVRVFTMFC